MTTKYHADTIERIQRVSRECEYSGKHIAKALGVSEDTVWHWARRGWVMPGYRSLRDIQIAQKTERLKEAIVQCQGDMRAVARELHVVLYTAKFAVRKAGLQEFVAQHCPERRCKICGAMFRRPEKNRVYCSPACQREANLEHARRKYELSRGEQAFTPNTYERLAQQVRDELWRAFGNVRMAARRMGKRDKSLWAYIAYHQLYGYLELCRARKNDPHELRALLEEHNWDHAAAAGSLGLHRRWLLDHAKRIGHPEIVTMRPCVECGRMHQRTGTARAGTVCSAECRAERQRRYFREKYARKRAQQQGVTCTRA